MERDHQRRESHIIIPDVVFERAGITSIEAGKMVARGELPIQVIEPVLRAAFDATPAGRIAHMREVRRRNDLRRWPWLRVARD